MRVGLLAHDLSDPAGRGLQRYTAGLARALTRVPGLELVLFARQAPLSAFDDIPAERAVWPGRREALWEQVELPIRLRRLRIDLLHAPSNRGLPAFAPCRTVLTRHDEIERLFPPDFPGSFRSRVRTAYADHVSVRRATRLITVSHRSRHDIERVWRLASGRVAVCGEGIDERFWQPVSAADITRVRSRWELGKPYVLYVGGFDVRKDVRTLLDAFLRLDRPDLLLALCGPLRGEGAAIQHFVTARGLVDRVRITGRVPDDDLPALYTGCELCVYPSRYEGFGLQAAEALAIGAPLVASDGGALPEIVGPAGVIFPVGDSKVCAEAMIRLLGDPGERRRLRSAGRERASALFDWARVVEAYIGLYKELLA